MFNHWKFENREILKKKITHKSVNCFLMDYLGRSSMYNFMSFANSDSFTSPFPV